MEKTKERLKHKNDLEHPSGSEKRTGVERRQFSYSFYIPERRCGKDRRLQLNIDIEVK